MALALSVPRTSSLRIVSEYVTSNCSAPWASALLIHKEDGSGEALSYYVINQSSPGGRSITWVCDSRPTSFVTHGADTASIWAVDA